MQPSITPSPSSRPASAGVALHRGEIARARPCARASCPATRWCRTKSCRTTTPGSRRSASTIQPCDSGSLPTWYSATSPRARLAARATSTSRRAPERRQQQRRVVGDAGPLRRHRRVVRDLHGNLRAQPVGLGRRVSAGHASSRRPGVPGDRSAIARPALPQRAPRPRARAGSGTRARARRPAARSTSPVCAVVDDVQRPARIARRHDRLLRHERLVRNHPVVLVDGRVVDAAAARIEIGELGLGHATGEGRAPVESALVREPLEPLAVRPVTRDDDSGSSRRPQPPRAAGRSASPGRAGSPRGRSRRTSRSGNRAAAAAAGSPPRRGRCSA